jgi:cytochrome c oxidase assembly factor CtaG
MNRTGALAVAVTDPGSLTLIALAGLAYVMGLRQWRARAGRPVVPAAQQAWFAAGLVVTAVAVASPLDGLVDRSLTAHMVQHVLLLNAAAPLLALGAPVPTLLWSMPGPARDAAIRASRRMAASHDRWQAGWVGGSLFVEAVVLLGWHLPVLYEAAVRNQGVHDLEHLTLLLTATVSWWAVVTGRRSRRGATAVAALVGSMSGIILGSALVVIPRVAYPSYVHGSVTAALNDQRMAGVVMWAFGGLLEDITGALLFASWLAGPHERAEESYVVPPLPGVPT